MKHTSISVPEEFSEDQQSVIDHIARKLTIGARRALLKLDFDWKTSREGYFSSSGAQFLYWQYQDLGIAEKMVCQKKSTIKREYAHFRLTLFGMQVKKSLVRQGIT